MATILIAGGTGMIGSRLSELLSIEGHQVLHLSRTKDLEATYPAYQWDLDKGTIDASAIEQADYIINLAGAGIADKPWTENRKKAIIESRTQSNWLLLQAVQAAKNPPKAFIAGAAIGIYGDRGDTLLTEESSPGNTGFLAESCILWESAINEWNKTAIRTVGIRIGLVLANEGGALPKMKMSLPVGVAPYFGDGQQWYSWIHIDDVCRIFIHAIENDNLSGYYNGVAPNPLRNKALMQVLLKVKGKGITVPAPAFALKIAMGEMAEVVLSSARVSSDKIQDTGFTFNYETAEAAFKALI
ncbi:MAG: TIGR01777 family oxidoreductase [Saprospiraceae bacterium]